MDHTYRPLTGVKVLDFSHVVAGPFSTLHLALMGAEVIKVENPDGGDIMRRKESSIKSYIALNAEKRSLSIDIATDEGKRIARDYAQNVDVVVDNLRPGVLEKHGLGFDQLREINPRIVYCSISGFGRQGEWGMRPAYDHVVQAASGIMMMTGKEGDPPLKTGFPVVDTATGIVAAMAILSGLRERDRTGAGMWLDVSMAASALQLMYPFACTALSDGTSPERVGNQGFSGSPTADTFQTSDGWIALGVNTQKQLIKMLKVFDMEDIANDLEIFPEGLDPDSAASFLRAGNPTRLKEKLSVYLRTQRAADIEARLSTVNVPAARVRQIAEFASEAFGNGSLPARTLEESGVKVLSPGLGFQVRR